MSKFLWTAVAISFLAGSTLAAQTAPPKSTAKKATTHAPAIAAPSSASSAAPQAKPADSSHKTMASAEQMKRAQQMLADKGLYKGKVDGHSSMAFKSALKKYQKDNQLTVTGRLDHETMGKLGIG